jgi:glutamine synthetase
MTSCCAEYVWIGGDNELRSKTRVLENSDNILDWDYDGSSTKQAIGSDSEVILKPCASFIDPFRKTTDKLVLCSTYQSNGTPIYNNHRHNASKVFSEKKEEDPWFGLEQEYFMYDPLTKKPLGYNDSNIQGQYYCSIGAENAFGRIIAEEHLAACLASGVKIGGINAEVAPGQWEFQIGICKGLEAGDHLWIARYILERIAEKHGIAICYHPKPLLGNWNGSGCHTNYSTKKMRDTNGLDTIYDAMTKLEEKHDEHIKVYGQYNELRLTGLHESSSYTKFSYGKANRGASVRIGNITLNNKCGYFEDRRPGANMDPYLVTSKLFETTCLF